MYKKKLQNEAISLCPSHLIPAQSYSFKRHRSHLAALLYSLSSTCSPKPFHLPVRFFTVMSFFSPNASQTTVCGSEAPSSTSTLHDIAWKNCMPQREAEAQELLRTSTNPEFIRLICSYFPFQDPKTCLEILSTRSPTTALDGILKSLRAKSKRILRRTCLEILEILPTAFDGILKFLHAKCNDDPPCSPIPIWDWKWSPPITTDAAKIADAIDLKISSTLYKVPFTELVRAACHRRSDVVKDLLDGVSATSSTLRRRIKEFYGPKDKYELVEKVNFENLGGCTRC